MITQKTCKIGARIYQINIQSDDSVLKENQDAHGYIDYVAGKIIIRDSEDVGFMKENLLHEILHGLLNDSGMNSIAEDQSGAESIECFISIITPRLCAFIQDNRELIETLGA